MAKRDELLRLYELAECKGYDVTQSIMRDHVRLIGPDGILVRNKMHGTAHSHAEVRRYLDALPGSLIDQRVIVIRVLAPP